jgi:hypothetical protein
VGLPFPVDVNRFPKSETRRELHYVKGKHLEDSSELMIVAGLMVMSKIQALSCYISWAIGFDSSYW